MLANRLALFRFISKIINKNRHKLLIAILLIVAASFNFFGDAHYLSTTNSISTDSLKANPEKNNLADMTHVAASIEADKIINNLFTETGVVDVKIPPTTLELRLVGILIKNNDEHSAQAIISVKDTQKIYTINAQLPAPGKVVLFKITRDYVVLNNNGHNELLRLYDGESLATNSSMIPQDTSKDAPLFYGRVPGPDEPPPYIPNEKAEEITLAEINRNFIGLMNMTIQRSDSNKQLIGYKIYPAQDANKFIAAGLQNGDMITAINGIPVTKAEQILESYEKLESKTVALEIERDGSVVNLEIGKLVSE